MTIAEPKSGSNANYTPPKITFTAGGNRVSIDYEEWLTGTPDSSRSFYGTFRKDGQYGVDIWLIADKGYAFSKDVTVVVNGIILPDSALHSSGKDLYITYFFGMDGIPANIDLPQTGDTSSLLLWGAALAVAAGALVVMRRRKRG